MARCALPPTVAVLTGPAARHPRPRAIRCRDLTCRFPGCSRPAEFCDIDHTIPFNHADPAAGGLTVRWNLKCLCRQHHRLKTFFGGHTGWRDTQLPDGTIVWVSPTGKTYRTAPAGTDLFQPTPPPRRTRTRAQDRAARVARARNRNCVQRQINTAARQLEDARHEEIEELPPDWRPLPPPPPLPDDPRFERHVFA